MQRITRRHILTLSAAIAATSPAALHAEPSLTTLASLLIDLPGWESEKPTTMNMTHSGITMSYAARSYEQGEKRVMAMLGRSGVEQQVPMASNRQADFSMETDGTSLRMRTLRGLRVFTAYNTADNDGMVLVYLGDNLTTTFVLQFNDLKLDDALALAQRFDWPAMQRAAAR